jgi:hypothetical protein
MLSLRAIFNPEGNDVGENVCLDPNYVREVLRAISKGLRKARCITSSSLILERAYSIKDFS